MGDIHRELEQLLDELFILDYHFRERLRTRVGRLDEPGQKVAAEVGEKGKLGVAVEAVPPAIAAELGLKQAKGVVVKSVEDGSPAARRAPAAGASRPRGARAAATRPAAAT